MSARGVLVLVLAMATAAAATYVAMRNQEALDAPIARLSWNGSEPVAAHHTETVEVSNEDKVAQVSEERSPDAPASDVAESRAADPSLPPVTCKARDSGAENGRIVGGSAANVANWPGIVGIRTKKAVASGQLEHRYFCGGVLIQKNWVVTAGHCIRDESRDHKIEERNGKYVEVRSAFGGIGAELEVVERSSDVTDVAAEQVHAVKKVIVPDGRDGFPFSFSEVGKGYDIALINIATPATGPTMKIAMAPEADPEASKTTILRVAGYGLTDSRGRCKWEVTNEGRACAGSHALQEARIPYYDQAQCLARWKEIGNLGILPQQICAGYIDQSDVDSCGGDSGGPLARLDKNYCPVLVGLTSYGTRQGCGVRNVPAVYTRVSAFADWINKYVPNGAPVALDPGTRIRAVTDSADVAPHEDILEWIRTMQVALRDLSSPNPNDSRVAVKLIGSSSVAIGDTRKVSVTSKGIVGYVLLLGIDAEGTINYLVPNSADTLEKAKIGANATLTFPGPGVDFKAGPPKGESYVVAIVSPDKSLWDQLSFRLSMRTPSGGTRGSRGPGGIYEEKRGAPGANPDESMNHVARTVIKGGKDNWAVGYATYTVTD